MCERMEMEACDTCLTIFHLHRMHAQEPGKKTVRLPQQGSPQQLSSLSFLLSTCHVFFRPSAKENGRAQQAAKCAGALYQPREDSQQRRRMRMARRVVQKGATWHRPFLADNWANVH